MDPCQFLKIVIGNLAIKVSGSNPSTSSCYCRIKFKDLTPQYATIPIIPKDATHPDSGPHSVSACFNLTKPDVVKLIDSKKHASKKGNISVLKMDVYYGSDAGMGCGFGSGGKLLGRVSVPLELSTQVLEGRTSTVVQNGWVIVGEKKNKGSLNPQLYLSVKAQPDPRFVFAFDGEPECSPQVFQVQGSKRQPVFSCNFSCRHSNENWNSRSSSETSTSRSWFKSDKDHNHHHHQVKERKGWSITIHDLSGSPVAAASMVTPFVPSQGSDWVSRSNPGAWLIMRPGDQTWKPWGRLESWRERAGPGSDSIGHRFELIPDVGVPASVMGPNGITLSQGSVPARSGGKFSIDVTTGPSPSSSPNSSIDFGSWTGSGSASSSASEPGPCPIWWPGLVYKGFVMSSTIGGEGKGSKPEVEIGSQHVTCTEDAAVFVALAAAMDLSVDACRPFSTKLRKELRQNSGEFVV